MRRARQAAVRETNRHNKALDRCNRCFTNNRIDRHLIVALGESSYLALPRVPVVDHHCLIVPMEHTIALTDADEEVWTEIEVGACACARVRVCCEGAGAGRGADFQWSGLLVIFGWLLLPPIRRFGRFSDASPVVSACVCLCVGASSNAALYEGTDDDVPQHGLRHHLHGDGPRPQGQAPHRP